MYDGVRFSSDRTVASDCAQLILGEIPVADGRTPGRHFIKNRNVEIATM